MTEEFLTHAEAAELMGVTPQSLRQMRHADRKRGREPKPPFVSIGNRVYYRRRDVEAHRRMEKNRGGRPRKRIVT